MTIAPRYPRTAPWWSPWGAALRLRSTLREPSDVMWCLRIGWFIVRLGPTVERTHLRDFMAQLASAPRPSAADLSYGVERVTRLREPWLRLPGLRAHDTCYVRALTLYRFLDATEHDARLRIGAEWFDRPGGVLRGHAWVTVDGEMIDGPPELDDHSRLQLIELG